MGYLQKPSQAEQWIVSGDDLDCMYAKPSGNVSLWCDMRIAKSVDKAAQSGGKLNHLPVLKVMHHPQSKAQNQQIMLCVRMK